MTAAVTLPVASAFDAEAPLLVECMDELLELGREFDPRAELTLVYRSRRYVAAWGAVEANESSVFGALDELRQKLQSAIRGDS